MSEEKLNELKEKVAGLQEELKEHTPEEIEKVFGGGVVVRCLPPINYTVLNPVVNPVEP